MDDYLRRALVGAKKKGVEDRALQLQQVFPDLEAPHKKAVVTGPKASQAAAQRLDMAESNQKRAEAM
eukprot:524109-Prorocentrum_lima.AAC.1